MFYRINGCNMIIYVKSMILLLLLPADFSNITHVELMFVTLYREHTVHPIDFVLFYFIVVSRQLWLLTSKGGRFDMKCYFTSFYFSFYSFSSLFSLFLFSSSSLFFLFLSLLLKAPAWKNCPSSFHLYDRRYHTNDIPIHHHHRYTFGITRYSR